MSTCGRFRLSSLLIPNRRQVGSSSPPRVSVPRGGAAMKNSEKSPVEGVELPAPATFFEQLAEKLGATARAAHIFGERVEGDRVTVIPVARARWGLGGGGG